MHLHISYSILVIYYAYGLQILTRTPKKNNKIQNNANHRKSNEFEVWCLCSQSAHEFAVMPAVVVITVQVFL